MAQFLPSMPGRRSDRRAGFAFGEAGVEGCGGQGGGHFLAEAGFVGAAGGPEEAGVALAVRGGADEAEQGGGRVGVRGR